MSIQIDVKAPKLRRTEYAEVLTTLQGFDSQHDLLTQQLGRTATVVDFLKYGVADGAPKDEVADFCRTLVQRYNPQALAKICLEIETQGEELRAKQQFLEHEVSATLRKLLLGEVKPEIADRLGPSIIQLVSEGFVESGLSIKEVVQIWRESGEEYLDALASEQRYTEKQRAKIHEFNQKASPTIVRIIEQTVQKGSQLSPEENFSAIDRAPLDWAKHLPAPIVLNGLFPDEKISQAIKQSLEEAKHQHGEFISSVCNRFGVTPSVFSSITVFPSNADLQKRSAIIDEVGLSVAELKLSGIRGEQLLLKTDLNELREVAVASKNLAFVRKNFVSPIGGSIPHVVAASVADILFVKNRILAAQQYGEECLPSKWIAACQEWQKTMVRAFLLKPLKSPRNFKKFDHKKAVDVLLFGIFRFGSSQGAYTAEALYDDLLNKQIINESKPAFFEFLEVLDDSGIITRNKGDKYDPKRWLRFELSPDWKSDLHFYKLRALFEKEAEPGSKQSNAIHLSDAQRTCTQLQRGIDMYLMFFAPVAASEREVCDVSSIMDRVMESPIRQMNFFRIFNSPTTDFVMVTYQHFEQLAYLHGDAKVPLPDLPAYQEIYKKCRQLAQTFLSLLPDPLPPFEYNRNQTADMSLNLFWKYTDRLHKLLDPHVEMLTELSAQVELLNKEIVALMAHLS